ncbi:MAG: hypothetical protein VX130_03395, partial [Verrucomicrobiota bacterium]|nr:hypothetical protein [Verrucomicrobiota bacterium]
MKNLKCILSINIAFGFSLLADDHAVQNQSRIEGTQRSQPAPVTGANSGSQSGDSAGASASDSGAQRPISLKEDGISAFFGYDTNYFYRS